MGAVEQTSLSAHGPTHVEQGTAFTFGATSVRLRRVSIRHIRGQQGEVDELLHSLHELRAIRGQDSTSELRSIGEQDTTKGVLRTAASSDMPFHDQLQLIAALRRARTCRTESDSSELSDDQAVSASNRNVFDVAFKPHPGCKASEACSHPTNTPDDESLDTLGPAPARWSTMFTVDAHWVAEQTLADVPVIAADAAGRLPNFPSDYGNESSRSVMSSIAPRTRMSEGLALDNTDWQQTYEFLLSATAEQKQARKRAHARKAVAQWYWQRVRHAVFLAKAFNIPVARDDAQSETAATVTAESVVCQAVSKPRPRKMPIGVAAVTWLPIMHATHWLRKRERS